jgi:hypothetical protein
MVPIPRDLLLKCAETLEARDAELTRLWDVLREIVSLCRNTSDRSFIVARIEAVAIEALHQHQRALK